MSDEEKEELRQTIVKEFTATLTIDEREALMTMSLYKLRKAAIALEEIERTWWDHRMSVDEGLIALDVLLGGIGGIRSEVKTML
jgi:hypothetical protein